MKSRNLFVGILILFVGVVALLGTLGVIDFNWRLTLSLWPLALIVLGVAVLPISDYLRSGMLVLVLGVGCLLYHHEEKTHPESYSYMPFFGNGQYDWWDDDDDETIDDDGPYRQVFSEPFGSYSHASLYVDFGAGELEFEKPCAELAKVSSESDFVKYNFIAERGNDSINIRVNGQGGRNILKNNVKNDLDIALSNIPMWTINIETGAADCDFDFSPYKVERVDIESGVCDMEIRLGDHGCDTEVNVESGVSNIEIEVPASMGCKIYVDSSLSNKDFEGFEKIEPGVWQTYGYAQAQHKIAVNLDCGLSNIEMERY